VLVALLVAMWYAGASQNNGAAYLLLFLLASVVLVSIPHTVLNLASLKVTAESVPPTFAGQEVALPVEIVNQSRRARHAIVVSISHLHVTPKMVNEISPGDAFRVTVGFSAMLRGEHEIACVCLSSVYPLGFLEMRTRVVVRQRYIVYPKPAGNPTLPSSAARTTRPAAEGFQPEGDDFAGVRAYVPGESQRHVDWKAVARGQPMMTKQFAAAETDSVLHLDFAAIESGNTEQRLSQLALWIIEAERAHRRYSLRLPSGEIPASLGEPHYHRCLRALALHK
jgi:uncharacterized protein (DUF58 family)